MTRKMYDATHADVGQLPRDGDLYAGYVTGSPDIRWTSGDWGSLPSGVTVIPVDQGFTGSPVPTAIVRDCETGAWALPAAVNRTGWAPMTVGPHGGPVSARPTLYLGFPDTMLAAHDAGWRGDVWIVEDGRNLDAPPPAAPEGINIVASQRLFTSSWDLSVVFDPSWPLAAPVPPPPPPPGMVITSPPKGRFKAGGPVIAFGPGPSGQAIWAELTTDGIHWSDPVEL